MDDFNELRADVREVKTDVKAIAITLAENTVSLKHHMLRTELNEARIKQIENWTLGLLTSLLVAILYFVLRK